MRVRRIVTLGISSIAFLVSSHVLGDHRPPPIIWQGTYGEGPTSERVSAFLETPDGGYLLAGSVEYYLSSTPSDVYVVRTDSRGSMLWGKMFGTLGQDFAEDVLATDEGHVLVGGSGCFDDCQVYLAMLGEGGELLAERTFGDPGWEELANCATRTGDGDLVVAGQVASGPHDFPSVYVLRLDDRLEPVWERRYGAGSASQIVETPDGGLLVAGFTRIESSSIRAMVLKTEATGELVWERTYGGGLGHANSIQPTADGGYIVAGNMTGEFARLNAYLFKIDDQGEVAWERLLGGTWGNSVSIVREGGYIVAGGRSYGGESSIYIVRTDEEGRTAWMLELPKGTVDMARAVRQIADGSFVIAGETHVERPAIHGLDATLIKLWSDRLPEPLFIRGDSNGDGRVNISDGIRTFMYLFQGAASPRCIDALDANDDAAVDMTDGIHTFNDFFISGTAIPEPGPFSCGLDPTQDGLWCEEYDPCH